MRTAGRHQRRQRARRRALQAIYQWQITHQDADEILQQFRKAQDFSGVDVEYFRELVAGVVHEHAALDRALSGFLDRPIDQVDAIEKAVLRLGAWELLYAPEIPFRVVLDEAVDLAHRFGSEQGHAYINGVLDKAARHWRPDETARPLP